MPGFAYGGGYLFSGLMNTGYAYGNNFYFSLSNSNNTSRSDLFVSGKTLSSHSAVQLPDLGDSRWLPVGSGLTVSLGKTHGVWYTCNYGASKPEELGTLVTQTAANNTAEGSAALQLLSKTRLDALVANNPAVTWTPMSVHGKPGVVAQCSGGFLFLPTYYLAGTTPETYPAKDMDYWCYNDTKANVLHITAAGVVSSGKQDTGNTHYVRFVK